MSRFSISPDFIQKLWKNLREAPRTAAVFGAWGVGMAAVLGQRTLERFAFLKKLSLKNIKFTRTGTVLTMLGMAAAGYLLTSRAVSHVNDDTNFTVQTPRGGSHAVAMAVGLMKRELDAGWRPNDPFFHPGRILWDSPSFQLGLRQALERFTMGMVDHLARSRGATAMDAHMQKARGHLQYPPDRWAIWPMKGIDSVANYRLVIADLEAYNARLAHGDAVFDRRPDNLVKFLDGPLGDLADEAVRLTQQADEGPFWSPQNHRAYFEGKGRMYGYCMILRALGEDFKDVLKERSATVFFDNAVKSLCEGAMDRPLLVMNGKPDSIGAPSHERVYIGRVLASRQRLFEAVNTIQTRPGF